MEEFGKEKKRGALVKAVAGVRVVEKTAAPADEGVFFDYCYVKAGELEASGARNTADAST